MSAEPVGLHLVRSTALEQRSLQPCVTSQFECTASSALMNGLTWKLDGAAGVRAFTREVLAACGAEVIDAAVAVASDLATSVIVHGCSPFGLSIDLRPDRVRVEVSGRHRSPPVLREASAASALGLRLVHLVPGTWGVVETQDDRTVWFDLPTVP
jgi:hypothetical protein